MPLPLALAAVFTAYVAAGKLGLALAIIHKSASPVWPPTGIALAALLVLGYRVWPAILLGAFVVNVTTEGSIATSLGIAVGNTLEGLVGAFLVNRLARGARVFERAHDILTFAALAAVVSTMVSATIGVTTLSLAGFAEWQRYGTIWLTWWLGDATGALTVAPALVLWSQHPAVRWPRRQALEAFLLLVVTVAVALLVFNGGLMLPQPMNYPVAFASIPTLIWAAYRFGPREAATLMLVLSGIATWGTLRGDGPFAVGNQNEALLLLQAFLATISGLSLTLGVVVAERGRVEEALQQSEVAYRAMFENNPHPMWVVDRDRLAFLAVNEAAIAHYGYSRAEFLGMTILDIRPPEEIPRVEAARRDFRQGRTGLGGHRHRTRDGRLIDVEITAHPLLFAGRPAVLVLAYDVTERKQAEEERRRLLEAEHLARADAEQANRAKDQFLATLSHELRTPLNAMLGWATMLRGGQLDLATQARALQAIERNVRLQTKLIDDLLDISRIVAGKISLERRPVELAPIVEAAVEEVRPAAREKSIHLEVSLDPTAGPVFGDPARLQQIMANLLSNAVKFTDAGGLVGVRLGRRDDHVEILVRDTGKGIPPELLPRVFDRFRQLDSTTTRAHGGLGLGLAIVRQLVELHGGHVRAASQGVGAGATFTVELPLAAGDEEQRPRPGQPRGDALPSLEGLRVLAVDDDADARQVILLVLEKCGARATVVRSAAEALEALTQAEFDVLVADIAMPGEDGYDLITKVRAREGSGRRMPALALTAFARREDRERALATGFDAHLAKPVEPRRFADVVAALAGQGR